MLDFTGKAKWYVGSDIWHYFQLTLLSFRDAWDSVKGTSKEDAMTKYVEALLQVCSVLTASNNGITVIGWSSSINFLLAQILKKNENEESKKYIAEIEAAWKCRRVVPVKKSDIREDIVCIVSAL